MTMMTGTAVPLRDAGTVAGCGGKATNLARLMACGAPVPDGFVLPDLALRARPLELDVDALLAAGDTVIVRSSAIGEDSAEASFAGQLDSVADVRTRDELQAAIARVWGSQRSERVLAYQTARKMTLAGMGVIVQRQVNAALSGVLFTVSPENPRHLLVEYCAGMGEALVSGAINPGRLEIDRPSTDDAACTWRHVAAPEERAASEALLLNDDQIARLTRLALRIERHLEAPQDIEWTIDQAGALWIVQSRPITAPGIHRATDLPIEGPADAPLQVWSNANVNENFPQPLSPLLYSIARVGYYHYFRNLGRAFGVSGKRLQVMEPALQQIIGVHGARMYYNLTSIHAVLRSVPFGDLLASSFNQFVGAEDTDARPAGAGYRVRQLLELAAIACRTTWQYLFLTRRVEQFEQTVNEYAARTHPRLLPQKPLADLLADFRGFLEIRCHRWKNASLADAGAMVCYGVLQRLLARAFPGRDQRALHNTLLKALPDLVSGIPALKLWELSRMIRADDELRALVAAAPARVVLAEIATQPRFRPFARAFERFLDEWGFRCSAELMLTVPSFQEDPAPVIELLKSYASMDSEAPVDLLKRQEAERVAETSEVLAALGWPRSVLVGTVLRWTQRSIQLRERARLKQALLYSRLRRVSLAIGEQLAGAGRLDRADDIFMLTADEVDLLIAGGAMFPEHVKPLVALRRAAHDTMAATTPPDSIRLPAGQYCSANASSGAAAPAEAVDGASLTGIGACGGAATARAAILLDVTESHKLRAGDILVTRQTDPGWGPIFPLISGLVIERGGMLSHGAIIAREFGIPSVVGVRDATRLIPQGGRITVDGNRGIVHVGGTA